MKFGRNVLEVKRTNFDTVGFSV